MTGTTILAVSSTITHVLPVSPTSGVIGATWVLGNGPTSSVNCVLGGVFWIGNWVHQETVNYSAWNARTSLTPSMNGPIQPISDIKASSAKSGPLNSGSMCEFWLLTGLCNHPTSAEVSLAWVHKWLSTQKSSRRRGKDGAAATMTYSTIYQLRSTASQYYTLDALTCYPGQAGLDMHTCCLTIQLCRPLDDLAQTLFTHGMVVCLAMESQPLVALLGRHVTSLMTALDEAYHLTYSLTIRRELTCAPVTTFFLRLGWLWFSKVFGLHWDEVKVMEPEHSSH
ncbi:hypothetical protein ACA910_011142 [Epithemia clementina (nom. ined.)]